MKRRDFLSSAAAAGVGAAVSLSSYAKRSPNDTVNVAIIGLRGDNAGHPTWTRFGRGMDHYASLSGVPNTRISHVVDVDERHFATTLPRLRERWGGDPKTETDFRRVLDDPQVDAITIAAPDHWHALMTVWACQAGKDVYVEKPVCHNVWEGRKMVEAARRYQRVVQTGTQRRSYPLIQEAVRFVREGGIGKPYLAKASVFRSRDPIGVCPDGPVPAGVHYDLWLGPARRRPFNENHFHYTWHWFWEYGSADLGNNGIHSLDVLRWAMNKNEHPRKIHCAGGLFEGGEPTDQETPNVQYATYQYADGSMIHCDVRAWYTGKPESSGLAIYGSKGWIDIGSKVQVYLGRDNQPGPAIGEGVDGREGVPDPHFANFIECLRSRRWTDLNADIEEGHLSTSLCLLGNISYRLGRSLEFDSKQERFVSDQAADALLRREYRKPYVLPERV